MAMAREIAGVAQLAARHRLVEIASHCARLTGGREHEKGRHRDEPPLPDQAGTSQTL
jgi:hypothetical protein